MRKIISGKVSKNRLVELLFENTEIQNLIIKKRKGSVRGFYENLEHILLSFKKKQKNYQN